MTFSTLAILQNQIAELSSYLIRNQYLLRLYLSSTTPFYDNVIFLLTAKQLTYLQRASHLPAMAPTISYVLYSTVWVVHHLFKRMNSEARLFDEYSLDDDMWKPGRMAQKQSMAFHRQSYKAKANTVNKYPSTYQNGQWKYFL